MESDFQLRIRHAARTMILDLSGDITKSTEQVILGCRDWEQGLDDGRKHLILNFVDVPYINSAGIALLIRLTRAGIRAGFTTFAYGLSPHYQKMFRMVGLTEYMMIYPDEYTALRRIEELYDQNPSNGENPR